MGSGTGVTAESDRTMTTDPRILVMDIDPLAGETMCSLLTKEGLRVSLITGEDPVAAIDQCHCDGEDVAVVLLAVGPEAASTLVEVMARRHPDVMPIVIANFGSIEDAIALVRAGASDYLVRPVPPAQLTASVRRALTRSRLLVRTHPSEQTSGDFGAMVGSDLRMHRVFDVARAVASAPTTVLMTGESGTGKSMIARAIHDQSPRSNSPFVEISCGSIPETLLESELFGHVKGAFTGAHVDKIGKFEAACGGTIFLDEINSAPASMQMKLLRVLQEKVVEPVGSNTPVQVDARVILATNEPLEDLVARGEFRQDLYYRIKVIDISLPPLRARVEDIMPLAEAFLISTAQRLERRLIGIDASAVRLLRTYAWPGNVRELQNVIERGIVLAKGVTLTAEDLPESMTRPTTSLSTSAGSDEVGMPVPTGLTLRESLEEPERRIILSALQAHNWNRTDTATALDINRTTLYKKMKRYGLDRHPLERVAA
jgi:DNA-binding NtrC family response regulator